MRVEPRAYARLLSNRQEAVFYLEETKMHLLETIEAYKRNDPAARNALEIILLYNGFHATFWPKSGAGS